MRGNKRIESDRPIGSSLLRTNHRFIHSGREKLCPLPPGYLPSPRRQSSSPLCPPVLYLPNTPPSYSPTYVVQLSPLTCLTVGLFPVPITLSLSLTLFVTLHFRSPCHCCACKHTENGYDRGKRRGAQRVALKLQFRNKRVRSRQRYLMGQSSQDPDKQGLLGPVKDTVKVVSHDV